ncbi:hypothetical protein POTOM_058032 [Populus tomentosa]|uniref:Uncharacterized protein n=1 Tax=Populus tomentosa TaxID=118781 RepID=A0A8X7XTS2_POPTO|nr:hypothetical protein POTOM_058032 [Populus tomentosa]
MASTAIVCPKNNVLGAVLALPDQDLQVMTDFIAFSSPSCSYIWLSLQLQARIFISPLRDQDLLVQDEKLNLVVHQKKRMQMLLDGQFRLVHARSNVGTYLKTVLLMNSMSVKSHERSVYLRSLMFGDSVPNPAFLVKNFNVADFVGKWFVTGGLFTQSTVQRYDAWDVVYTRSAVLPESIVLELEMAARRDFNKFISTDNKGS